MNRGDDDKENNEEKKIVATRKQFKEHKDNESNIPELICKLDKDNSSDDSSEDDTPRRSDTPRRREQIPIEKRLKQLKEVIERISSAQRGNRMSGLQERNREDSDSESDNEEEDDNNKMPGLQDRDREDSDSEDDEEDDKEDDEHDEQQQNIRTSTALDRLRNRLATKSVLNNGIKTKSVQNSGIKTKSVRFQRNSEGPSQLRTKLSRIAEEILPHSTPEKRLAPMESEGEPITNGDEGANSEEDLRRRR